jgi:LPXTG-motif cell wall-anchored protein
MTRQQANSCPPYPFLHLREEYGLNITTLSRRLLAGTATLAIGLGGALAVAAPAQATFKVEGPRIEVKHVTKCEGLSIKLKPYAPRSGNSFRVLDADGNLIWPEGVTKDDYTEGNLAHGFINHGSHETLQLDETTAFPVEVSYWSGSNPGGANWRSAPFDGVDWPVFVDWQPKPGQWPTCGDSPKVEIVEDCDGNVTVTVHAGDTRRTWRVDGVDEKFLDIDEYHTWDAASLDALVEWWHEGTKEWKEADKEYVTRTTEEDCPGDGGGDLPDTGAPVALLAGSALMLLVLGGGLFLVSRRRQVRFTA